MLLLMRVIGSPLAAILPRLPAWIGVQMGAQKMGYFSRDEFKAGLSEVGLRGRRAGDGGRWCTMT